MFSQLNRFLMNVHRTGSTTVLLIDEAHLLTAALLEEIRLLTNLETSQHKLLQILLVPTRTGRLACRLPPHLRQLKQRVALRFDWSRWTKPRYMATSTRGCNSPARRAAYWSCFPRKRCGESFSIPVAFHG